MNTSKINLIKSIHDTTKFTYTDISVTLTALFDVLGSNLEQGNSIEIRGFCRWKTIKRAPRPARNPRNGDPFHIPARIGVKFKPCQRLLRAMNP